MPKKGPKGPPHIDFGTGKVRKDLGRARREGRAAAGGQLGTISDRANRGINKQLAAADKRTSRILANMDRISRDSRKFGRQQRKGIEAETAHQVSLGGVMSAGLTASRSRSTKTATKAAASVTSALGKSGEAARNAEMQAIRSGKRSESQQDRASLSILDVLAAERKSEDVKFVQTMQHDEDMANFQAEQAIYMAKLQSRLQWNLMKKKADAEGSTGQLFKFSTQVEGVEAGIDTVTSVMTNPAKLKKATDAYPTLSETDAIAQYSRDIVKEITPGDDTEMSAINKAITATVSNYMKGELAPTWDEVSVLIAGTSPEMNKYMASEPGLKDLHDEYAKIRTQYRDEAGDIEKGIGDPSTDIDKRPWHATESGSMMGTAATVAEAGMIGTGIAGMAYTAARAGGLAGGPVGVIRAFLSMPGAFQGAVGGALAKAGMANPFKMLPAGPARLMLEAGKSIIAGAAGESGTLTIPAGVSAGGVLAGLGLITAAGVVSRKLINDAAVQFVGAEESEDVNLQSTFNLMDTYAESVIAGNHSVADLEKIAADITESGDAGNLWSGDGWTGPQKEMVANRLSVLKGYIEAMVTEQARANYASPAPTTKAGMRYGL